MAPTLAPPCAGLFLSDAGFALLEEFEGRRLRAYLDGVGIPTIGYGHTAGVKLGDVCTAAQADHWLHEDVAGTEAAVRRLAKVQLKSTQFDALVLFAYNVGAGNLAKSDLLRYVNEGNENAAAAEFLKWNKAGGKVENGLTRRRAGERELFLKKVV